MPTLIIVGFQYDNAPNELPSMVTDVYLVYSFYKELGFRIYMASDAMTVRSVSNPTEYIVNGIVKEDYLDFIQKDFMDMAHYVKDAESLKSFFESVQLTEDRRLIVYYTGHGKTGGVLLPNKRTLSAIDFRSFILNVGKLSQSQATVQNYRGKRIPYPSQVKGINTIGSQIFLIMDCCNPHGLYLPYKVITKNVETNQSNLFICPDVILIVPCDENLPAIAHDSASPFTKNLICTLKDPTKMLDLPTLIKTISIGQNSIAYTSYPHLMVLWPWTFTNLIDCRINELLDSIVIKQLIK
jgi:hypothetical protein